MTLVSKYGDDLIYETHATRKNIFVVTAARIPWFQNKNKYSKKKPEIIVLGMAFMRNHVLTIDIEDGNLLLNSN